jgi:hypothetical protein
MTSLSPALLAAILLVAIPVLNELGLPAPSASTVIDIAGAKRTTAYKLKAAIEEVLPELLKPPGRPPGPPPEPSQDLASLHREVLLFLFDHPGAVGGSSDHRHYSDAYRFFALDLCEAHRDIPLELLAQTLGLPLPTLKDWLRGELPHVVTPESLAMVRNPAPAQIQAVLDAWERWDDKKSGFSAFCSHVWFHLRIPFGKQNIKDILAAHGVRSTMRRGRPPDASVMRGTFNTFFPGAQWIGDGTELTVSIAGLDYTCNLELLVDADSGAFVGASIRPNEDAAAVTMAFDDAILSAGHAPIALLLDNKPSNHSDQVIKALDDTLLLRSRPYYPTDKPHIEGAFGLLKQEVPPLVLTSTNPAILASQVAQLVVMTWVRAVNHRPRLDREGKTRAMLFRNAEPSEQEVEAARAALLVRQRKQNEVRKALQKRLDPIVRKLLDEAFIRFGFEDPENHLRNAIASWPIEAVVNGIAIFEGKKNAGTLPKGVDARYLKGIVHNLAEESEGWAIAMALLTERLKARDLSLALLEAQQAKLDDEGAETPDLLKDYIDKALASSRNIDRTFWLLASADLISGQIDEVHKNLLRLAARRIHSSFAVPHEERLAATRFLFAKVIPVS